jgi:outer membrane lipoprotein LolB
MRALLSFVVLLFAGCASLPERPPVADVPAAWAERQAQLVPLNAWNLRGRLALRTEEQGAHASLQWVRARNAHRLNLVGPFGGGRVRVVYDGDSAELRDASGRIYQGESVQDLLRRATGWQLPLTGLNYWILGLPAPGVPARSELDDWGRLKTLEQLGWRIEFIEYTQAGNYEVPKRVFIKRQADDTSDELIEVRLVIEQWALGDAPSAH